MLSRHFASTIAALLAALAASCTALAQLAYDLEAGFMPLDRIIGTPLKSARGEVLGSIKDLIVDTGTLRIEYVVIERPAGQDRLAVYPVDALVAGDRGEVLLDAARVVDLEASSAAGGTALAPARRRTFAFAARDLGRGDQLVVDLIQGTLRLPPK